MQCFTQQPSDKISQNSSNSYCQRSLASAFHSIGDKKDVTALENCIEELLALQTNKFRNIIHFANDIKKYKIRIKGEQNLRYNMNIWNKKDAFDILNDK